MGFVSAQCPRCKQWAAINIDGQFWPHTCKPDLHIWNSHHRNAPAGALYIGRPGPFGNPFEIGVDGTRAEVIAKHLVYARKRAKADPHWLDPLRTATDAVCWCAPQPCHGRNFDILFDEGL